MVGHRIKGLKPPLPALFAAAAALAVVGVVTLHPVTQSDRPEFSACVICGEFGLANFIANVLLFIPPAIALRWAGLAARRTVIYLAVVSAAIEVLQLFVVGRDSALGDVLANAAGGALGTALFAWWPRRRRSDRGALAAAAAALAVMGATSWIMQPELPPTVWYGQWTAEFGHMEHYRGRVLAAAIERVPLPSWRLDSSAVVRSLFADGAAVRVMAVAGPLPPALAPIFSIADDAQREILLIGADGEDLLLRLSTRATSLRLQYPAMRWRGALAGAAPGDTLYFTVRRSRAGLCVSLNGTERCDLAPSIGAGWRLVENWARAPLPLVWLLNLSWLAILSLPLGLLARRDVVGWAAAAAVGTGAIVIPAIAGLAVAPVTDLAAISIGVALGAAIRNGAAGRAFSKGAFAAG